MAAGYTQTDRPLKITTPLGQDVLLIREFRGHEDISHLFNFEVNLIADLAKDVRFEHIIGQSVTVEMRLLDGDERYFNGIVRRHVRCFRAVRSSRASTRQTNGLRAMTVFAGAFRPNKAKAANKRSF